MSDFLLRAALAGIGVALATAPLGCFVVWRRMAYFGDATAHAAILGIALALGFEISVFAGVFTAALLMGIVLTSLSDRGLSFDSVLGVLAHGSLAAGLVAASLLTDGRVDLMAFLFGDILAVNQFDLLVIWLGAFTVIALLSWRWSALLTVTLNPDLAQSSGISPKRENLVFTIALALTVAVGLKVVGALLVSAMLILPPAAARALARSPETMAVTTALFGIAAVIGGLWGALIFDTPTGPTIVTAASIFFALSLVANRLLRTEQ